MKKKIFTVTIVTLGILILVGIVHQALAQESSPKFTIKRMVIASGIENREPVEVAETFPVSTEKVYCFIEASDIKDDTEATFVWYYKGKKIYEFSLPLQKGAKWRTFAYKNLRGQVGEWKAEIRDSAGNSIHSISFEVEQ